MDGVIALAEIQLLLAARHLHAGSRLAELVELLVGEPCAYRLRLGREQELDATVAVKGVGVISPATSGMSSPQPTRQIEMEATPAAKIRRAMASARSIDSRSL